MQTLLMMNSRDQDPNEGPSAVSEALAEGMTLVDYAPITPIAEEYIGIASWLRTIAAPAAAGFRNVRWTER